MYFSTFSTIQKIAFNRKPLSLLKFLLVERTPILNQECENDTDQGKRLEKYKKRNLCLRLSCVQERGMYRSEKNPARQLIAKQSKTWHLVTSLQ